MAEDYEREDFERLSDGGSHHHHSEDYYEENEEAHHGESHKMRLSIDIHSIKETTFKGLVYAKYGALSSLGIKPFMTIPAIQITKANVEEKFKNSFASYEFVSTQQRLYPTLAEAKIEIEVYHQDRFKKDILIGIANVDLEKVLHAPEMQTPQSFVRTFDAYLPLDEVDEHRHPIKRVALLRTIVYLEDLGPLDYLRQHDKEIKAKYKEELDEIATIPAAINLNMAGVNVNDVEKVNFLNELSNIEYKIIWELENWKKAEEAKFRYQLKSKEVDFLKKLNEEWKKKELDREKIFKKSEAQVQQIETKLKQKTAELQKREQKLVLLEEELKQKITETSRQLAGKEEEINVIKKKHKDERTQLEKDRTILTAKNEDLQSKFSKLQEEYMTFRKEQETSPINLIKTELSAKDLEIHKLRDEVEKANLIKKEYETYYNRLKNEIIRSKKENETLRENLQKKDSEVEQLKIKLSTLAMLENKENIQSFKNEFQDLKSQFHEETLQQSGKNPFRKNYLEASGGFGAKNSLAAARGKSAQERLNKSQGRGIKNEFISEYERLVRQKEDFLNMGIYDEDDPLIVELNEQIRKLER